MQKLKIIGAFSLIFLTAGCAEQKINKPKHVCTLIPSKMPFYEYEKNTKTNQKTNFIKNTKVLYQNQK